MCTVVPRNIKKIKPYPELKYDKDLPNIKSSKILKLYTQHWN